MWNFPVSCVTAVPPLDAAESWATWYLGTAMGWEGIISICGCYLNFSAIWAGFQGKSDLVWTGAGLSGTEKRKCQQRLCCKGLWWTGSRMPVEVLTTSLKVMEATGMEKGEKMKLNDLVGALWDVTRGPEMGWGAAALRGSCDTFCFHDFLPSLTWTTLPCFLPHG